ncbi:SDR family oxidoreductase [Subsaximicrobium wynnwilliamsii]|uniref:SDR family oxidoreductase n=1 Tax=Subsaximicrobium wynnwilliamsii TaxID=291179 RepID=A0A5C6ZHY2_9FLAO|nr:SDR family oxidoreductase [Subsaximicrobium wynnwilliamsii]TXD82819.1 SDR family oxidoreductase [Subsaximicrobium wynnwilliamsii]TXD88542.1 SDR family oxidoreductase [Subsaximicrobium wynnwilliamsii]TXE02461.1 SDR family oxidoreductase [Subsaximicrobium wynnwilliamsii]
MESLKNKVALITGGTKGIGYGVAEALLNQGLKVVITSRDEDSAKKAAKELGAKTNAAAHILGVKADVRKLESQQEAVKQTIDKFGKLDIVIANAGVGKFASIEDMTSQEWNDVIDTNLTGVFNSIKASVDELKKNKGYYITISSLAGANFFAGGAAYNASKFGVTGFTQAVMLDLRQHGVKVSTIMPGSVSTHFNGNEPSEKGDWKIQIEDLGELVVDLLKMNPRTLPSKIEVRPSMPPA